MDSDGTRFAEISETTSFLHYFSGLPDHRQAGKVDYPLPEVLLLILLAVLAGAEAFTDIARFGERKIELLRRFRPYLNGTPSHDHLGDIFATLDARAFQLCFVAWVAALTNTPAEVIAIDGKTSAKLPSLTLRPIDDWGRRCENGPIWTSSSTSEDSSTLAQMRQSRPITVSMIWLPAPIRVPSPILVLPRSTTPGSRITSEASSTVTST